MSEEEIAALLVRIAKRIENQKGSYLLAHSGLAYHVMVTIAEELKAEARELKRKKSSK